MYDLRMGGRMDSFLICIHFHEVAFHLGGTEALSQERMNLT